MDKDIITLGHGSGTGLTRKLIDTVFNSEFKLPDLGDAVEIGHDLVVTTDAHVVSPLFFPGGDIGKLSVTGTINDLAVKGAVPLYLMAAFIIEEGFSINQLKKIVISMQNTAEKAGVRIIAGDTKVVQKGKGDGVFITTSGVGSVPEGIKVSTSSVMPGDHIIINGTIADHAVAIINAREDLGLDPAPNSDCAALNYLVQDMLKSSSIHFMRDATRGGVATVLNEVASETGFGIVINEEALPYNSGIKAVSEMLGLDPLYLANEGKLIAFTPDDPQKLMTEMEKNTLGKNSSIIGKVTDELTGVYLKTVIGSLRPLAMIESDPLPRIC
jgi:hydrogenase expression/formation protein HypE